MKPKRRAIQRARQVQKSSKAQRVQVDPVSPSRPPSQRSVTEILEQLKRSRSARDEAEAKVDALVDQAVDLGVGWPDIAAQLGVTRQGARQRYQRRHGSG